MSDMWEPIEVTDAGKHATPISEVHIGMWKADGTPIPLVSTAVCDTCGAWATNVWQTRTSECPDDAPMFHAKIRRVTTITVYTCDEHWDAIGTQMVNEYGMADAVRKDKLTAAVERRARKRGRRT